MITLHVKTPDNKYHWFVIDSTISEIQSLIMNIGEKHENKKILYYINDATENDIENYGGIAELGVVEHVIEAACLLDVNTNEEEIPVR